MSVLFAPVCNRPFNVSAVVRSGVPANEVPGPPSVGVTMRVTEPTPPVLRIPKATPEP